MLDFNSGANSRRTNNNINDQLNSNNISKQLNKLIDSEIIAKRKQEKSRSYLGASRLGASCSRMLQYEYRNIPKDEGREFTGQALRVFEVGHVFEEMAINWLQNAGFSLLTKDSKGKQYGFTCARGKIAGHVDGIITAAPDSLNMQVPALWEVKSMKASSWKETVKKGLTLSKPIYAAQIALYQAYMEEQFVGISKHPALFTAINKDTAELYHELIPFDTHLAQRMSDKAVNIIKATEAKELLPRVAASPDFYECKYCSYQNRCWEVEND